MTDWQALISGTAVEQLARTGRILSFRLCRRDLFALAQQMNQVSPDIEQIDGFLAIRAEVWCAPLGRCIRVDEWRKPERKRAYRTHTNGRPYCVEGPADESAEAFDADKWQGKHVIAIVHGHERAYELREVQPPPDPAMPTLRWDPVLDRATLDRLGLR